RTIPILVLFLASSLVLLADAQIPTSGPGALGVRGTMLDPAYEPLAGYRVRMVGPGGDSFVSGPIDTRGRFWINQLPPGKYEVQVVSAEGRLCDSELPAIDVGELGEMNFTTVLSAVPVCAGEIVIDELAGTAESQEQPAQPEAKPKGGRRLARILVAAGIGVGALLLLDDDKEKAVSEVLP
ncbi:MAG: carboxypeptidase-like regulatory domain-containing protein, partial [Acidobacteriota bacterium]|nr:carboxypeptidase-like regulatory domain-containing protein [Acidobacteriota bacterium]